MLVKGEVEVPSVDDFLKEFSHKKEESNSLLASEHARVKLGFLMNAEDMGMFVGSRERASK